jgi:hypothetical protein
MDSIADGPVRRLSTAFAVPGWSKTEERRQLAA